jgi:hypothetical protein
LGQGAPEVEDDIEGSFPRPTEIDISMAGREYGPTAGIKGLRAAVANVCIPDLYLIFDLYL